MLELGDRTLELKKKIIKHTRGRVPEVFLIKARLISLTDIIVLSPQLCPS
jgi:hypothetical protein